MEIKYDKSVDAKYVQIKKGKIAHTKKEREWLLFDYAENGDVLGVEILNASQHPISLYSVMQKLLGYSIADSTHDDKKSLGFVITAPEYKEENQAAFV